MADDITADPSVQVAGRAGARMGRPRLRDTTGTGDARRDILSAAARLISERGLHNTTMAQIAEAAGLQTPSMYYYFDGKAGILRALAIDANRAPLEIIEAVNESTEEPAVRLWAIVALDVRVLCALPFDINEVHRFVTQDEESGAAYAAARAELIDVVAAVVRRGIADGAFIDVDPGLAALTLLANDEGSQNWLRSEGGPTESPVPEGGSDPAVVGAFLADLALRGLLADPSSHDAVRSAAAELVERLVVDSEVFAP